MRSRKLLRRELQVVEVAGRVTFKRYPKSKVSRRTVPLLDTIAGRTACGRRLPDPSSRGLTMPAAYSLDALKADVEQTARELTDAGLAQG